YEAGPYMRFWNVWLGGKERPGGGGTGGRVGGGSLRPRVGELHLDAQVLLTEQPDDRLEVVPGLAEHAHLTLPDLGLDLERRLLDQAADLLRLLSRGALLDVDALAIGAARGRLPLRVDERVERHATAVELRLEHVEDLLQDVVVVGVDGDRVLLQP